MSENDFTTVQETQAQELQTVTNEQNPIANTPQQTSPDNLKFCKFCGSKIPMDSVLCVHCGRQVEELKQVQTPNITINNSNNNANMNMNMNAFMRPKNKWVAFFLCLFLGFVGAHKFYENKAGMGVLYILTFGLFGIGWLIDLIVLLFKPNPYFV